MEKRIIEHLEAYLNGHECGDPNDLVKLIEELKSFTDQQEIELQKFTYEGGVANALMRHPTVPKWDKGPLTLTVQRLWGKTAHDWPRKLLAMPEIIPATRTKLGYSHGKKYSYWMDAKDSYIYQMDESTGKWIGWYAYISAWERTMHRIMEAC